MYKMLLRYKYQIFTKNVKNECSFLCISNNLLHLGHGKKASPWVVKRRRGSE